MSGWILIACLKQLFAEFDQIAPSRGHASDGSIGDTAHQHEVSDHNADEVGSVPIHDADLINEVHAIDVDVDLREPGLTMEAVVQFLLGRVRSGKETRLRYIIYNRRIWEADNGWRQRAYTGASAHTEHAHFSASYDTAREVSTASWHLEDIPVALTAADETKIRAIVKDEATKAVMAVFTDRDPGPLVDVVAGNRILSHEVPDGTQPDAPQVAFYTAIKNLGIEVAAIKAKLDAAHGS